MPTLQEADVTDTRHEDNPLAALLHPQQKRFRHFTVLGAFIGLAASFALSILLTGLVSVRERLNETLAFEAAHFQFLVLSQGNRVEVDEVGRSLRQLDG